MKPLLPRPRKTEPQHVRIWLAYVASMTSSLPSVQQNGCQRKGYRWKARRSRRE